MIYILLPVHNRLKITELFIQSLYKQVYKKFELIVIDDGSIDGTTSMIKEYFPKSIILKGDGNLWWAGSLQKAYDFLKYKKYSHDDMILIINDDVIFDEDFLKNGVSELLENKKSALLAKAQDIENIEYFSQGIHIDWQLFSFTQASKDDNISCLSTRGLFLYYSDFLQSKGFYPKILPHYFSDYEFTIRLQKQGIKLMNSSKTTLQFNSKTTGQRILKKGSFSFVLKQLLSKRYVANPVYTIVFIFLSAPLARKIPLTFFIMKKAKDIIKYNIIKKI